MFSLVTNPKELEKVIGQCERQIQIKQGQLERIPSDCLTNTPKRLREEAVREAKRQALRDEIAFYMNIKDKATNGTLENIHVLLLKSSFRKQLNTLNVQNHELLSIKNTADLEKVCLPEWVKEIVLEVLNILNDKGITDATLLDVIKVYENLSKEKVDENIAKQRQIKAKEQQLRLYQGNDIHFTPEELTKRMIKFANINENSTVLEPSAGIGMIADAIREVTPHIDCIEWNMHFTDFLNEKGYSVANANFLKVTPTKKYQAIVMNPPFSNNQDCQHIIHAYDFLEDGGTLVALTSQHYMYATDKASKQFIDWIEDKLDHLERIETPNFEKTKMPCILLVLKKPEKKKEDYPVTTINENQMYYDFRSKVYIVEQFEFLDTNTTPPTKMFSCVDGYEDFNTALKTAFRLR